MAVVVAFDPWALLQAGFWLSFVAVGVLFAADPGPAEGAAPLPEEAALLRPWWRSAAGRLAGMLREQWVITLALTPLSLLLFNQVSVVGLLANALAQAQAFMVGQPEPGGHRDFPGNRPSTFLVLDDLTPASLGALIALQEHRVFVSGSVWGINSFDQWGVELGKALAGDLLPRLTSAGIDATGLDGSTAGLLARLKA